MLDNGCWEHTIIAEFFLVEDAALALVGGVGYPYVPDTDAMLLGLMVEVVPQGFIELLYYELILTNDEAYCMSYSLYLGKAIAVSADDGSITLPRLQVVPGGVLLHVQQQLIVLRVC